MRKLKCIMLAAALSLVAGASQAQDNAALLDLLVKKKVITDQEAETVRADLVKEYTTTPAGKLNVGSWVQEMKISGDIRERYQWSSQQVAVGSSNVSQQSMWRFRLRIRDEFKLANNWFGGFELSTGAPSDSGNQTYGDTKTLGAGGSALSSGFGKYGIFISRAYLGWNAADWLTVVVGKQANPFYTTDMVWDPDINPDGLVEQVKFHKMYLGGSGVSDGKGGTVDAGVREERPWELTLNMGQFIFSDNAEYNAPTTTAGHGNSNDAYLFVFQLQGTYKFNTKLSATFAPGFMFYNPASVASLNNSTSYPASSVTTSGTWGGAPETSQMAIFTAPGDVTYKIGTLPLKFYWDLAFNTLGEARFNGVYGYPTKLSLAHTTQDDLAWLVGLQLGENKKAGDWMVFGNFRQTGISSVDPNLNDSDFALGQLNTQGFKVGLVYNFTDFCTGAVTYYYAWSLRDNLTGGQATGGAAIANSNNVQILQVDLSLKF